MLKSSSITISQLLIRFLQFDNLYNKKEDKFIEEIEVFYQINNKVNNIPLIKNFQMNILNMQKSNSLIIIGWLNYYALI